MTPNKSLELSHEIQKLMKNNLLGPVQSVFPFEVVEAYRNPAKSRDRVFNCSNTLLTMVLTAFQEDKTLQNSLNIFKLIHTATGKQAKAYAMEMFEKEKLRDQQQGKSKGRPKKYHPHVPKSKTQSISNNTAAWSKARGRVEQKLVDEVYAASKDFSGYQINDSWNGKEVFITDGTYFQMQDTPELRKKYYVTDTDASTDPSYPQGLLQGMVKQGSGCVWDYEIGTRHQSELELAGPMLSRLPEGSLLLADDLYNTYAIFSIILANKLDIIVPGKRVRNYKVIEQIVEGDEIVEIKKTSRPAWLPQDFVLPQTLRLRKITYKDSNNETEYVLYTTILDVSISKSDLIAKYLTRWDIEITIREIKTIMDVNVARSKTEAMVFKEMAVALIAYNLIRKIIAQSAQNADNSQPAVLFPPQEDIIQKFYTLNKKLLIDKKGRRYNRWSPGRYGKHAS